MRQPAILFICVLLGVGAISCSHQAKPGEYKNPGGITLDADVPGSEVYLAGQKLGTVPVTLSAEDLTRLGVPNPRTDTNAYLNSDAFGESVFVARKDALDAKRSDFTYLVPQSVRSEYVAVETPWGIRTRMSGGTNFDPQKSIRVNCAKTVRRDGMALKLVPVDNRTNQTGPWKLKAVLSNHGTRAIKGFRPKLMVAKSFFTPRTDQSVAREIKLPKEWENINPGQSFETEILVEQPDAKGDYGLYVIFELFKNETSNYLAGDGWLYSNTRLLSVK